MRKRYRVLVLAAIIAAVIVPVGFALSRESDAVAMTPHLRGATVVAANLTAAPVVATADSARPVAFLPSMPDGAKLLFVGTVLFGVAAAMRRAA